MEVRSNRKKDISDDVTRHVTRKINSVISRYEPLLYTFIRSSEVFKMDLSPNN